MNVTVSIDRMLCKKARHRAVDEGLSLSSWVSKTISKEIEMVSEQKELTLLDALGDVNTAHMEIDVPRSKESIRGVEF